MTPLPPAPSPAKPPQKPRSRIVRVLRSRYFLYPFLSYVLGYLQGILRGHRGHVSGVFSVARSIANTITIWGVVVIVLIVIVVGGAVRNSWRNRNPQGRSGVFTRRASDRGAMPPVSGLMAGAGWRVMRAAARLMPRAAGSRWLAEAASFLAEAPPAQRRRALRNYLAGAPQTILASWACHLARRTRAR